MTPIIVGYAFDVSQPDGQHGLGAFQRLNLALLVHTQHHRVLRGVHPHPQPIYTKQLDVTEETLSDINKEVISSECYETFRMAIAESYGCSTPVICIRKGVMQELVADGRTGLHFTPADSIDLTQNVKWAWSNPDHMTAMCRETRCKYEAKYTAEQNYPPLLEIYNRAIQGASA